VTSSQTVQAATQAAILKIAPQQLQASLSLSDPSRGTREAFI
jgi:hypothetical protein